AAAAGFAACAAPTRRGFPETSARWPGGAVGRLPALRARRRRCGAGPPAPAPVRALLKDLPRETVRRRSARTPAVLPPRLQSASRPAARYHLGSRRIRPGRAGARPWLDPRDRPQTAGMCAATSPPFPTPHGLTTLM